MTIENVALGLVSGFAGALFGVWGAFRIADRQTEQARCAASRAIFMELAANSAALDVTQETGVYVPLYTTTWQEARLTMANALSAGDFAVVATAYHRVQAITNSGLPTAGSPSATAQTFASAAFARVDLAADIALRHGWPDVRDRKELMEQLKSLTDT